MGAQGSDPGAKEALVRDPATSTAAGADDEGPQQGHAETQGTETQSGGQDRHGEERHAGTENDPEDTKDTQDGEQQGAKGESSDDRPGQLGRAPLEPEDATAAGTTEKPAAGGESQAQPTGNETPADKGKTTSPMQRQLRAPRGEERPFDFNRFLEQMRHRSAVPVNEYVKRCVCGTGSQLANAQLPQGLLEAAVPYGGPDQARLRLPRVHLGPDGRGRRLGAAAAGRV